MAAWLNTSSTATGASSIRRYGTPGGPGMVGNISCNSAATKHLLHSFASATPPLRLLSRERVDQVQQLKLITHSCRSRRRNPAIRAEADTPMATEKSGIKIINNPPESKLSELGVRTWPKWGCPPSKFPWTYSSKETCYLLKGKVKVYPDGSDETVEIGAGDLVEFPKGMSCTWDVSEAVDKHYNFD